MRYIGEDGRPSAPRPDELSDDDLRKLFSWMVLLRTFDERAVALQRQGRIGTYPMFWGEEATQAGVLMACRDEDWIFPSYRQGVIAILRGLAPSIPLKYRRGYGGTTGFWNPRDFRVGPSVVPIATQIPRGRRRVGGQDPQRPRRARSSSSATERRRRATSTKG